MYKSFMISFLQILKLLRYVGGVLFFLGTAFVFTACSSDSSDSMAEKKALKQKIIDMRYEYLLRKVNFGKKFDIVFTGDSLTYFGDFENKFRKKNCVNLGISDLTINGLRLRLDMIQQASPKKIFIMIGINSFFYEEGSFEVIVNNYESLIKEIKKLCPSTEIYVESLLPTSSYTGIDLPRDLKIPSDVVKKSFNKRIAIIAKNYGAKYLDLYSLYEFNGELNPLYSYDGTHLKPAAYQLWYDTVAKLLD